MKKILLILTVTFVCFGEFLLLPSYKYELSSDLKNFFAFQIDSSNIVLIFTEDNNMQLFTDYEFEYESLVPEYIQEAMYEQNDSIYSYFLYPPDTSIHTTEFVRYCLYPEFSIIDSISLEGEYSSNNVFYSKEHNSLLTWVSEGGDSSSDGSYWLHKFLRKNVVFHNLLSNDTILIVNHILDPDILIEENDEYYVFYSYPIVNDYLMPITDSLRCLYKTFVSKDNPDSSFVEFQHYCYTVSSMHWDYSTEYTVVQRGYFSLPHLNYSLNNIGYNRYCRSYSYISMTAEPPFGSIREYYTYSFGYFELTYPEYYSDLLPVNVFTDDTSLLYFMSDSLDQIFLSHEPYSSYSVNTQPIETHSITSFNNTHDVYLVGTDSNFCYLQCVVECDNHIDIKRGWNMVSIPVDQANPVELGSISNNIAFEYDTESNSYIEVDSLMAGKGYFLLSELSLTEPIYGEESESIHLNLKRGWNMIGSLTDTITTDYLATIPVVEGPIYTYNNATGSYEEVTELLSGKAYWVLCTGELEVTVYPSSFFVH